MINPGPVQLLRLTEDISCAPQLGQGDLWVALLQRGIFRLGGSVQWSGLESPLLLLSSDPSTTIKGRGELQSIIISSPLIESLLKTSFSSSILPVVQKSRREGVSAFYLKEKNLKTVESLITKIEDELDYREEDWLQVIELHILQIFTSLIRCTALSEKERTLLANREGPWTMADVLYYLENHYDDPFTLHDLASRCALNSSYFSRAFKGYAGIPLFEYLNRIRIDRACGLLRNSNRTILDIALTVGYNNVSFFNRYFRRLKQISPAAYRKKIREK